MSLTDLPYAVDAESPLTIEELSVLRRQFEKEVREDDVTTQTKFNYAWGLIKSRRKNEQQLGVRLLAEIFRESPERRRECLYYLALGHFKLGEYTHARDYNDQLLQREPNNLQAQNLKKLIEDKLNREGLVGAMIMSGVVGAIAIGGLYIASLFKDKRR
ncbi:4293_t:CDS:2 [Dentiscutata heterogama]|uniref:4293_t:CDS:1 n=1 Tax=Dentiscutata heterogama TaxID=1316150 RepID=A0ACA9JXA5_9GLOM|nr:4293_t:CDS:2 [Dentiscutata heterogama]